MFINSEYCQVL